jgi:hypothetical protein
MPKKQKMHVKTGDVVKLFQVFIKMKLVKLLKLIEKLEINSKRN